MSPTLRIVLFLSTLGVVFALVGSHVFRRLTQSFAPPRWLRLTLLSVLVAGIAASFAGRMLGSSSDQAARALGMFGGAVTLSVMISSVLLWPYEILLLAKRWFRLRGITSRVDAPITPQDPERRDFLTQTIVGGAVGLGTGSSLYGTFIGRHDYEVEDVPVRLEKLPKALDGLRIVQISDIHVGLFVGEAELSRAAELIAAQKPDVVVMTGDLVDHDIRYAPELGRFARRLDGIARYGTYAIPGNHDHYAGVRTVHQVLREAGVDVLLNRHIQLGDAAHHFILAGVDDVIAGQYGGEGPRLDAAFRDAPTELARVLLSHNPSYFPTARHAADLVLSGHTHGGQITLFINPAELVLKHGYIRGLYANGNSQIYVNRGFGTAGPPARVGSRPEITRLTLVSG